MTIEHALGVFFDPLARLMQITSFFEISMIWFRRALTDNDKTISEAQPLREHSVTQFAE